MRRNTAPEDKHTCKFRRHTFGSGNTTYFCANGCNKKIKPALALGRESICWRCGNTFKMTEYSIRLAKPHCDACHKPKNASDLPDEVPIRMQLVPPSTEFSSLSDRLKAAVSGQVIEVGDEDI